MQKKNNSLFVQDDPRVSPPQKESQSFGKAWRKIVFQAMFKSLEVLLMIVQIIHYLPEIPKIR